jgi:hypothetical protein
METTETNVGLYGTDLDTYKNRNGTIDVGGLIVAIRVVDSRFRYGHIDLKVVPISGRGERWMESGKVSLI